MEIDLVSGTVTWTVPDGVGGKYPVTLFVTDAHGGRTQQSYVLDLRWESVPANAD